MCQCNANAHRNNPLSQNEGQRLIGLTRMEVGSILENGALSGEWLQAADPHSKMVFNGR